MQTNGGNGACECGGDWTAFEPGFFRALAEPNRIALLLRLAREQRPVSVSDVADCCPVDLSVVSRHLKALKRAGLVVSRRQGKSVLYRVDYAHLVGTLRSLAGAIESCCPGKVEV